MNATRTNNGFANKGNLNEEIAKVKASRKSLAEKVTDLVKLGLLEQEAQILLRTTAKATKAAPSGYYTFGVEIECYNAPRPTLMAAVRNRGLEIFEQTYNSEAHTDHRRRFKVISDGSLSGANTNEIVTPVLTSANGMGKLKKVCEALAEIGAGVNRSCGLHCHIGAADLTDKQYCNVFKNYYYMQDVIDTVLAPSRRGSAQWCHYLPSSVKRCFTRDYLQAACHHDRYFVVNPMSYDRHKTIEFRQHQGSTNFVKIQHWVHFCAKLVEWSKTNVLEAPIASIDEIAFLTKTEKTYFKGRAAAFTGPAE